MGAFNIVLVDATCPTCLQKTVIRCQTHVASSFVETSENGRFFNREYRLGEEMAWWPPGHPRFALWRLDPSRDPLGTIIPDEEETCYSVCTSCSARLKVTIDFEFNRPRYVRGIEVDNEEEDGHD